MFSDITENQQHSVVRTRIMMVVEGDRCTRLFVYTVTIVYIVKIMWPVTNHTTTQEEAILSENLSETAKEKYSNFYLEGSQNIDLTNFRLIINNDVCGDDDIKIITIVTTALENDVSEVFAWHLFLIFR